jgi:hypothetical protein
MNTSAPPVDVSSVTALIAAGSTELDRLPEGESLSPWAPATRSDDDRSVRTVQKQKPKPLDVESLAKEDMSPIAIGLLQVSPVTIPQEFHVRGNQLVAEVERLQQEGFELLELAEKAEQQGDWGVQAAAKVRAAEIWGSAAPLRQELAVMAQQFQQAAMHNDRIAFQQEMLRRHPWTGSARAFEQALRWAEKTYDVSRPEIMGAHPNDILAGLAQYEIEMKAQGKKLSRTPAAERANSANVRSKADRLRAKNNGRLTQEQQRALVGEMLRGIEI